MKYISVIILAHLALLGCGKKQTNEKQTTRNITIDTLSFHVDVKQKNRIYYLDDFGEVNYLNQKNNFVVLKDPYFQLIDGKFRISYLLKKGDNVTIIENGDYVELKTNDVKRNIELSFPMEYFKKFELNNSDSWITQKALLEKKYQGNPLLRDQQFDKEEQEAVAFLTDFKNKNDLTADFFDLNKSIIKYKNLERRLTIGNAKFPTDYLAALSERAKPLINNDNWLFLNNYRNVANSALNILKITNSSDTYTKLIDSTFKGETRNYLMAIMISNASKDNDQINKSELDQFSNHLLLDSTSKRFKEYTKKLTDLNSLVLNNNELIDSKSKKVAFSEIGQGKLTYIDFWASWCLPCRAEMPQSKLLSKIYEKLGMNFIYVSMDKNPTAWEKAVSQIGFKNETSFILPEGNQSTIGKKYKITSIPRYMIMDKNGKIINSNAPRPSDTKIRKVFDELLK